MMKKAELVFIPGPGLTHLISTVELSKLLINRADRLSITILTMKAPSSPTTHDYTDSVAASTSRIRFIHLPQADPPSQQIQSGEAFLSIFIQNHKPHVKHAITQLISPDSASNSVKLAGLVVDLFSTTMIDIAKELGVPAYLHFTTTAAMLGLMLHLPTLHSQITSEFMDLENELKIPCFANSVPLLALPPVFLNNKIDGYTWFLYHSRMFRETKGIIINTFAELEPNAVNSFANGRTPPVYPVGPLLDLDRHNQTQPNNVMKWLEHQPPSSVIFLCFGTMGSFGAPQVKEIALGLERSGHRFLWSLRRPPAAQFIPASDYTNFDEVVPNGFLERTVEKGLLCGWAPQAAVLEHRAVGAFVTHCGWNSVLESLWFGVPMVAWPLYAEQKLNAFELVKELGLAVEMRGGGGGDLVMAEEVERGVRSVMDGDNEVRSRAQEMREKSRGALMDTGSSLASLGLLAENLMEGI